MRPAPISWPSSANRDADVAVQVEVVRGLGSIRPQDWDSLAGENNPFVEHAFLRALEESGSVGDGTGWLPTHVVARVGGKLVGAIPLYLKDHSYGEYIFDWGWARAARGAAIPYYPKLVAAVPFTPVTGPRLLLAGEDDEVADAMIARVRELAEALGAHSVHFLFCTEPEQTRLVGRDYLPRLSCQYHWENTEGWESFDDYLGAMRAPSRKQVRRERRLAREHGLQLSMRTGEEMGEREWDALWQLYRSTVTRKGGMPYLTHEFFGLLRRRLGSRVRVAFAHRGDDPVAASLCLAKGDSLYGRYWGCFERLEALHFELCYYLPIEYCLDHGLRRFEAGAQGEHKIKRGLLPVETYSAHWMLHAPVAEAVGQFVGREAEAIREEMTWLAAHGPFRRGE